MPKNSKWARPKGQVLFKRLCSGLNNWPQRIFLLLLFSHQTVSDFVNPWTAALQASLSLSLTISWTLSSCPLNQWCHPSISSAVALFSCLQSFPASGCFRVIYKGYVHVLTTRACERDLIWKRILEDDVQLLSQIEIVLDYPSRP